MGKVFRAIEPLVNDALSPYLSQQEGAKTGQEGHLQKSVGKPDSQTIARGCVSFELKVTLPRVLVDKSVLNELAEQADL
jgi:hypothetical protein